MSQPDLLAALDPEQRQVAEALRGPVRVLAGAGTGKTRAITHRIAHGVATGVYAPTEVLAVTFTTRAAGEMRSRLRQLGAGGVQARTFHAAALRQLRYFWPHVYGTELPTLTESKIPMLGRRRPSPPGHRRPGAAARPRLRGRVGQGQQRPSRRLRPARHRARPVGGRAAARDGGPPLRRLRGGQARPGADGHGGRPAPHRRPARRGRACRRAGTPSVQVVRRRRVPGRLAPPARRCSTSGSAAATSCAWWATPRRRSTPSPAPTPTTCATSPRGTRAPPRSSSSATTAPPPRSWWPPTTCSPAPAARVSSCARSSRPVPRSPTPAAPTRSPRRRRSPSGSPQLRDAGHPLDRGRGPVPHQRPVGGLRGGARRPLACPTSSAAPAATSTAPRSARPSPGCAAQPGAAPSPSRSSRPCAASSPAWAGPRSRRRAAARPATAGSRGRR